MGRLSGTVVQLLPLGAALPWEAAQTNTTEHTMHHHPVKTVRQQKLQCPIYRADRHAQPSLPLRLLPNMTLPKPRHKKISILAV